MKKNLDKTQLLLCWVFLFILVGASLTNREILDLWKSYSHIYQRYRQYIY